MLVYGRNVAIELLKSNEKIRKIYLQENFEDKYIISLLENKKLNVEIRRKKQMDDLADGLHQGIILDIEDYKYAKVEDLINEERQELSGEC